MLHLLGMLDPCSCCLNKNALQSVLQVGLGKWGDHVTEDVDMPLLDIFVTSDSHRLCNHHISSLGAPSLGISATHVWYLRSVRGPPARIGGSPR